MKWPQSLSSDFFFYRNKMSLKPDSFKSVSYYKLQHLQHSHLTIVISTDNNIIVIMTVIVVVVAVTVVFVLVLPTYHQRHHDQSLKITVLSSLHIVRIFVVLLICATYTAASSRFSLYRFVFLLCRRRRRSRGSSLQLYDFKYTVDIPIQSYLPTYLPNAQVLQMNFIKKKTWSNKIFIVIWYYQNIHSIIRQIVRRCGRDMALHHKGPKFECDFLEIIFFAEKSELILNYHCNIVWWEK